MRNNDERLGTSLPRQDIGFVPPALQQTASPAQAPQLTFIAPTEFVQLPSRGKFYPSSHPLHGKDAVEVKQMTAKEEDILTSKSLIKKGVVLDRLVEALLLDKSIRVDDLLAADKNAIIINARISGYGPEYVTQVACPACEAKSKHKFDLLEHIDVPEEEKPDEPQATESGTFLIQLPKTGWNVEVKPLTTRDERALLKLITDNKNKDNDSTLTKQLELLIQSINGEKDRAIIAQAVGIMPALDSKVLRKQYANAFPDMNLRKTFVCSACSHEEIMEVPITADFFWPK